MLWAQSTTKDYIRAEHKLHPISKLFISQAIIPQVMSFFSLFRFRGHSTLEPASSRVTYFILRVYTGTSVSHCQHPWREAGDVWCLPPSGISGLSFDSTLLSPLLFFCLVLLLFLSYHFLSVGPFFWTFSRKFFNIFVKRKAFLYVSCLAAGRSELVGGMCGMLPYDTGICCYAFMYCLKKFLFFCPFLFYAF